MANVKTNGIMKTKLLRKVRKRYSIYEYQGGKSPFQLRYFGISLRDFETKQQALNAILVLTEEYFHRKTKKKSRKVWY